MRQWISGSKLKLQGRVALYLNTVSRFNIGPLLGLTYSTHFHVQNVIEMLRIVPCPIPVYFT